MKFFTPSSNPDFYSQILSFKSLRAGITLSCIQNIFRMKILGVHWDLLQALSCATAFRASERERSAWRDRLANWLSSMYPYRILNADEINWLLFAKGLLT
jgi:hypothetical protein